ncbi:MAG: saccharopine dehydrogenase NADP-binding domain-containing protein [Candidatus Acidiferrales bacterium]
MRIFVLGAGGTGSLLAQLLARQGHTVWCGDRDTTRAERFLGKKNKLEIQEVNARNLWSIVRAARGCHLLVNAAPAIFNEIVLRAALRLRAHYLDLNSRLTRNPFKAEQLNYHKQFAAKNRVALIDTGVAPGLTNLLVKRGTELLDTAESARILLYESTESEDPVSMWSAEVAFDQAVSRPRLYRNGRFQFGRRFSEREIFRFAAPTGAVPVYLAAQDEVATLPHYLPLRSVEAKIGGEDIERLRRWHRQGKLSRSRGIVAKRFPQTPTPRQVARLIRRGVLENARFAAAIIVRGEKKEQPLELRWDAAVPTLYQIRVRGLHFTPISYATAHVAALFVRHFPKNIAGVFPPEALPAESRRGILSDVRLHGIRLQFRMKRLRKSEDDEEI